MPTPHTARTDRPIAAVCRDAAGIVLDSHLAYRLSAASIHTLLDLRGRSDHEPVSAWESWWLHGCIVVILEAEAALGEEVAA